MSPQEGNSLQRSKWQERYLRRFYDPTAGWVDGTQEFYSLCRDSIKGGPILENGSGPSNRIFCRHLASCTVSMSTPT